MPGTQEVQQYIREQHRDNVLTTALYLFARQGRSTTMSEIVQQAGGSQGPFYYVSGKEEIFRVAVDKAMAHGFVHATVHREMPAMLRLGDLLSVIHINPGGLPIQYYQFVMQMVRDRILPESLGPVLENHAQEFRQSLLHLTIASQEMVSSCSAIPSSWRSLCFL